MFQSIKSPKSVSRQSSAALYALDTLSAVAPLPTTPTHTNPTHPLDTASATVTSGLHAPDQWFVTARVGVPATCAHGSSRSIPDTDYETAVCIDADSTCPGVDPEMYESEWRSYTQTWGQTNHLTCKMSARCPEGMVSGCTFQRAGQGAVCLHEFVFELLEATEGMCGATQRVSDSGCTSRPCKTRRRCSGIFLVEKQLKNTNVLCAIEIC